jgi:hypothetical protein
MTVNEDYIVGALKKCLKALHQKWPDLVPREWISTGPTLRFTPNRKCRDSRPKKPPAGSPPLSIP